MRQRKEDQLLEDEENQDEILEPKHQTFKNPKKALLCSVLLPGLGQLYNSQVTKSLLVFILFFIITGGSAFYFFLQLGLFLLSKSMNLIGSFWATISLSFGEYFGQIFFFFEYIFDTLGYYMHLIVTKISFPPPPLTSTIWRLTNYLIDNIFFGFLFILILIGVYLLQAFDAFRSAKMINNREIIIIRSRRKQFIRIFTINFLPYVLLLLPIPYVNVIVYVCFSSSETITELIDAVGNTKKNGEGISAKHVIYNQLKGIALTQMTEFVYYSAIILFLVVYVVWYLIVIILWLFF